MDPEDDNLTLPDPTDYLDYFNLTDLEDFNLPFPTFTAFFDHYYRLTTEDYGTNYTTNYHGSNKINTLKIVAITISSIIFALGIIGNGLVIWIAGFRMKKTISAVWFLHLAIADLLCCTSMPLYIADWASDDVCLSSPSSAMFCFFNSILLYVNMSVSVLLLTAMSVDRWVSVMWLLWTKVYRTRKLVGISVGIIWVLGLLWTGVMTYLIIKCDDNNIGRCDTGKTIPLISLVLMFVIPFLIIFTSYVTIFLKLRKSNRPQRSQRPYRIITAVILCFFICWAPFYIWPLIPLSDGANVQLRTVDVIANILACLNSCINPIIYVFMGKDFRHRFLRSIPFRLKNALSDDLCKEQEDPEPSTTTPS
ncbi:C3a anaphylatoxin chemotactic receptor-like [Engystomops pustulosus]|uniref:C3a anaphylatoxin chemotactic receptor-like n=1 Tax=Engystomops pustulosus TaxID=76066 RepID=UPI003AFA3A4A